MKLYHGTSEYAALEAMKQGLKPRSHTGTNNWEHTIGSNPDGVYLTDTYACHFAFQAMANGVRMPDGNGRIRKRIAVIEVETAGMRQRNFHPDEDAWEQAGRGKDGIPGNMKERTFYYRKLARNNPNWEASLRALGTCAYYGIVTPRHFTRIAFFEYKKNRDMAWAMQDGSVNIQAFRICGLRHKNYVRWLFGEELLPDPLEDAFESVQQEWKLNWQKVIENRAGIEVLNLRKSEVAA